MIPFRFFLVFVIFCIVSSLVPLHAAKTFQVIFLNRPESVPQEVRLYVNGEEQEDPIVFPRNRFSGNYEIEGQEAVQLHFTVQSYEDPKQLKSFPTVKIPATWSKFLLLAFEDPSNASLPIRFLKMDASGSEFKAGDFRFMNFLDNKFAGKVGSKKLEIKGKGMQTIRDFAEHNTDFRMQINVLKPEAKVKVQTLTNKRLRYNEKYRTLFFVYEREGSRRITYHAAEIRGL